MSCNWYKMRY